MPEVEKVEVDAATGDRLVPVRRVAGARPRRSKISILDYDKTTKDTRVEGGEHIATQPRDQKQEQIGTLVRGDLHKRNRNMKNTIVRHKHCRGMVSRQAHHPSCSNSRCYCRYIYILSNMFQYVWKKSSANVRRWWSLTKPLTFLSLRNVWAVLHPSCILWPGKLILYRIRCTMILADSLAGSIFVVLQGDNTTRFFHSFFFQSPWLSRFRLAYMHSQVDTWMWRAKQYPGKGLGITCRHVFILGFCISSVRLRVGGRVIL